MKAVGYIRRHFRQLRQTFMFCILLTSVSFVFISYPIIHPLLSEHDVIPDVALEPVLPVSVQAYTAATGDVENASAMPKQPDAAHYADALQTASEDQTSGIQRQQESDRQLQRQQSVTQSSPSQPNQSPASQRNQISGGTPSPLKQQTQPKKEEVVHFVSIVSDNRNSIVQINDGRNAVSRYKNYFPFNFFASHRSQNLLEVWQSSKRTACRDTLEMYHAQFARLVNVLIDAKFCVARAKGGEDLTQVMLQSEDAEYYTPMKGCFKMFCPDGIPPYRFTGFNNYLNTWLMNMQTTTNALTDVSVSGEQVTVENRFTIALQRRDYANLYWSMNDWYATFLMMTFYNKTADTTNILLVDAHPQGKLDDVWSTLFQSVTRFATLSPKTLFPNMVWGLQGYHSQFTQKLLTGSTPVLMEQFRTFFLQRFGLNTAPRPPTCTPVGARRLSIRFVWRHDYVAHPRNPRGLIERKLANEEELINSLRTSHPTYTIEGVQLDLLSMADQLKYISEADILIGMHGAGLAHVLMLQQHAVLIELYPNYYATENRHFADLARWRKVGYIKWMNMDLTNERPNFYTHVPVSVVEGLIAQATDHICADEATRSASPLYTDATDKSKAANNRRIVAQYRYPNSGGGGRVPPAQVFHQRPLFVPARRNVVPRRILR